MQPPPPPPGVLLTQAIPASLHRHNTTPHNAINLSTYQPINPTASTSTSTNPVSTAHHLLHPRAHSARVLQPDNHCSVLCETRFTLQVISGLPRLITPWTLLFLALPPAIARAFRACLEALFLSTPFSSFHIPPTLFLKILLSFQI